MSTHRSAFVAACALALAALVIHAPARAADAAKPPTSTKPAAAKPAKAEPDSIKILEAAVAKDSTNALAQYRLGIKYLDKDRPVEATRAFTAATKSKPEYVEAWVNLGAAQDANGHGAQARDAYRQALKLRPNDPIAKCRMASSYYATGMKDSAMTVMRETLKGDPKSACTYFTLGVAFADANMFRDAIKAWEKVVEYAPGSPEAESANESIKLLKDFLGPQEALAKKPETAPGVPMGAGGPGEPIKGGEMMNSSTSVPKKLEPAKTSDAKTTTTKSGGAK